MSTTGLGLDWRDVAGSNVAKVVIRSRTDGEIQLSVLGDDLAELMVTGGHASAGVALQQLLASIG